MWVQFLLPVLKSYGGCGEVVNTLDWALACVGSIPITRLFILLGDSQAVRQGTFDSPCVGSNPHPSYKFAGVAELADALDSKSSVRKDVPVRPPAAGIVMTRFLGLVFSFI